MNPHVRCLAPALSLALALSMASAGAVRADGDRERAAAEELALRVYYEGIPASLAGRLGDAGAERLEEMLVEPEHAAAHANILILLGMAGRPGAFEALRAFEAAGSSGGVDRAAYRARRALPEAMGHLARGDRRAHDWLVSRAEAAGPADWWFGPIGPERIGRQLRRNALLGLALSGRPEARRYLRRVAEGSRDADLAHQARRGLEIHARIREAGLPAVQIPEESR